MIARLISLLIVLNVLFHQPHSLNDCPYNILPGNKAVKGWSQKKSPECFTGDELFIAIDGAAEVYLEYGFLSMARSSYAKKKRILDIEIYLMKDDEAAYGIMTSMNGGKPLKINEGCVKYSGNYYGMLVKGKYFAIITDPTGKGEIASETDLIIRHISANIKEESRIPEMLSAVSNDSVTKEVLFNGDIVLNNHYYFGVPRPFNYEKGIYTETSGAPVIIFKCKTGPSDTINADDYLRKFEETGRYSVDYDNDTLISNNKDTLKIKFDGNLVIVSIKKAE
jgi:hypothetical protein